MTHHYQKLLRTQDSRGKKSQFIGSSSPGFIHNQKSGFKNSPNPKPHKNYNNSMDSRAFIHVETQALSQSTSMMLRCRFCPPPAPSTPKNSPISCAFVGRPSIWQSQTNSKYEHIWSEFESHSNECKVQRQKTQKSKSKFNSTKYKTLIIEIGSWWCVPHAFAATAGFCPCLGSLGSTLWLRLANK